MSASKHRRVEAANAVMNTARPSTPEPGHDARSVHSIDREVIGRGSAWMWCDRSHLEAHLLPRVMLRAR